MGLKLGDISPLAGVISGKGVFGNLANSGALGGAAALISNNGDDEAKKALAEEELKNEEMQKQMRARRMLGMKKGGSVSSASKRADGCATKGKTKGRFV
jgi:hypothetical protein